MHGTHNVKLILCTFVGEYGWQYEHIVHTGCIFVEEIYLEYIFFTDDRFHDTLILILAVFKITNLLKVSNFYVLLKALHFVINLLLSLLCVVYGR